MARSICFVGPRAERVRGAAAQGVLAALAVASLLGALQPWRWGLPKREMFDHLLPEWQDPLACVASVYVAAMLALLARTAAGPALALGVGMAGLSASALATSLAEPDIMVIGFGAANGLLLILVGGRRFDGPLAFATAALPALMVWAQAPRAPGLGACILVGWAPAPAVAWLSPTLLAVAIVALVRGKAWAPKAMSAALFACLMVMAMPLALRFGDGDGYPDGLFAVWLLGSSFASAITSQPFADLIVGNPWAADWLVVLGLGFLLAALAARRLSDPAARTGR